ncbi:MAG: NUDIX pyrophosphatase [Christensenellaceae bacterium]|nr:NUDIX pyrophosphatase [Christensenellaceae bacterium]
MRAPMQVLILPFTQTPDGLRVGVLHRSDMDAWQFISGGAEDDETPVQAARRECREEANLSADAPLYALDSRATVPSGIFRKDCARWGERCFVVPEYAFAIEARPEQIVLSHEHIAIEWLDEASAAARLTYDSNRTALWELAERIRRGLLDEANV